MHFLGKPSPSRISINIIYHIDTKGKILIIN